MFVLFIMLWIHISLFKVNQDNLNFIKLFGHQIVKLNIIFVNKAKIIESFQNILPHAKYLINY